MIPAIFYGFDVQFIFRKATSIGHENRDSNIIHSGILIDFRKKKQLRQISFIFKNYFKCWFKTTMAMKITCMPRSPVCPGSPSLPLFPIGPGIPTYPRLPGYTFRNKKKKEIKNPTLLRHLY